MRISIALFVITLYFGCVFSEVTKRTHAISPTSDSLRIVGRVKSEKDSVTIYWPGTMISFRFTGKSAKVLLRDEKGKNYFNVVIDGDSVHYFRVDSVKRYYVLADSLADGPHEIQLIKRTEWDLGKTWFYGIEVEGNILPAPPKNNRVIEFFGNSITAGYAIENDTGGDSPDSIYTNNYHTYAAITARHFKADYYCTVKSGIGITISWFPLIMPEMYDRLDPSDSTSKWNFKAVQPDIVVINLFQNDSWLMKLPDHPSFKQRFGTKPPDKKQLVESYRAFVQKIREVYPNTYIVCALGNMDATKEGSPWPGYVSEAVKPLNDSKVFTHFFPYMNKGGHPRKEDNAVMAKSLIEFIEKNIKW